MQKKTTKPKTDRIITESFFIKYMQGLKGFMLETFATKGELRAFSDKTQSNFENVFSRLYTLETENEFGTHHTRELEIKIEDHEERMKTLEHRKN